MNGEVYQPWQEAVEEEIDVTEFNLSALATQPMQWPFRLSATQEKEAIRDAGGLIAGIIAAPQSRVLRERSSFAAESLGGRRIQAYRAHCERFEDRQRWPDQPRKKPWHVRWFRRTRFWKCATENSFPWSILRRSCRDFARPCQNVGTWPVLVGEEGQRDTMLSSPIILYDYPQIAPESPGDLFDGAEIDEILSLRIMTLTDEEKREMRQSDERARQILERTENMPDEQWMKLHGALRGLRSAKGETP